MEEGSQSQPHSVGFQSWRWGKVRNEQALCAARRFAVAAVAGQQNTAGAMRSLWKLLPAECFQLPAAREFHGRHRVSFLVRTASVPERNLRQIAKRTPSEGGTRSWR